MLTEKSNYADTVHVYECTHDFTVTNLFMVLSEMSFAKNLLQ